MLTAHTFRLFVSSTFSDFVAEREALQKRVFPELEKYCAERGAQFQAVDLRWGITEEAQREHDTMRICLEEVRRCQQLSPRPNFAVLMGDRYGWEPVPARIPQDHWLRLINAASQVDRELIKSSYRLDENAVPPVYCLRERTPDDIEAHRQEANLLQALRRAAKGFRGGARLPYFASATHQEIALGALSRIDERGRALKPEQHVHVYIRHTEGMPQDESAKDFIDWDDVLGKAVQGARQRLRGLETQLRMQLGDHIHDLHTSWNHHGRNGAVNKTYLKRFCNEFLNHHKALIDAELAILERKDERQLREQAHQHFGAERARVFAGRRALLERISRYTSTTLFGRGARPVNEGSPAAPLIILGGGGSGKSAMLALAAQESVQKSKRSGAIVLQRYIGGVPGTESLMTTLITLTADIASLYGRSEPPTPENAKMLAENFQAALEHANSKRPLILYLDALDQLDKADSAWMLEWLPKELPEHVRVVTSVRTDTNVEQSARRRYPKNLIEVPAMSPAEGRAMLGAWLADKRAAWFNAGIAPSTGRLLTPQQEKAVLVAFNASGNGSPLWLKLAYEEAASWASWYAPRQLPNTIPGMIEDLIDRRLIKHENHPKAFTERALAYLAAGRFGLSERELGRVLGTDKAVRAEFQVSEKTQKRWEDDKILPPILWSRLFFDLEPYLGWAQVDGELLMRWFHREFGQVLKSRYLASDEDRMTIHSALADTLLELERELRPEETNDDALFRKTDASGKQVSAALRRVMEQPWQLAQANRQEDLQKLLIDFGFCMGKCAANRSNDLSLDCIAASANQSQSNPAIHFCILEGHVLRRGTTIWAAHRILLQRSSESGLDQPMQIAARKWLELGLCDWDWLRLSPIARAMPAMSLRSVTEVIFEGHESGVHGAFFLSNGQLLSWSLDGSLKLWDTSSGQCLNSMTFDDGNLLEVQIDDDVLAIARYAELPVCVVWNVQTGEKVAELIGHLKTITGGIWLADGRVLTWSDDGTLRIWIAMTGKEERLFDRHTASISGVCVLVDGRVASWSESGELWIWNSGNDVASGQVATFIASSVLGALLPADGRLVYWTVSGSFFRADQGLQEFKHVFDAGLEIVSAGVPTHALEVASGQIAYWHELMVHHGTYEHVIEVWDLDRRELRGRLAGHQSTIEGVKVAPGNRLISYDNNGETRLWDLEHCSALGTFQGPSQVWGVCPVGANRILASGGDVRVWDIEARQPIAIWNDFDIATGCMSAPRNRTLVMHYDGLMRLVNVGGELVKSLDKSYQDQVTTTCVVGDCIIAGYQDGNVALLDSVEGQPTVIIPVHDEKVKRLVAGVGDVVISVGEDGVIGLIDLNARTCRWKHATGRHVFGAWQTCERTVLVGLIGHGFLIFDAESGKELISIPDAESRTSGLREDQSAGLEIFQLEKKPAEVWDCSRARRLYALDGHEDTIFYAKLISKNLLVTASKDRTLRAWSHPEGVCRHVMRGHSDWVTHFDVIDARRIVSRAGNYEGKPNDTRLRVWDVTEGKCLGVLTKHKQVIGGTLLVESERLISWSSNGEVCLWCLQSLDLIAFWQWNWGDIKSMSELKPGVILARNRAGRGFVWSLDRDTVEEIDLHNIIDVAPSWFKPSLRVGFVNGLSTADLDGQCIDRRLVVRRHGSASPIYWDTDDMCKLLSVSRQGIIGIKAGRRVKFLELFCT
jgi:WD40 repeat protein